MNGMTMIEGAALEIVRLKKALSQAEAERDVLAELTTKFAEHYGACEICPANGVTCTESDCQDDLLEWAIQEAAKPGEGV